MNFQSLILVAAVGFGFLPAARADDAADIAKIRQSYDKIGKGKPTSTRKIEFKLEDQPMEGTITHRAFEGGLSSVTLSYTAGDHGGADEHFYYTDGAVFFIFVKAYEWRFAPDSTAEKPASVDTLTETRYYIRNGTCVRALKRSATSRNAGKLPALVAKEENKEIEPGEAFLLLVKRAAAMRKVTCAEEAVGVFSSGG